MAKTLQELEADGVKVVYSSDRRLESKAIASILLPFTPEQWVGLIKVEGPYLPACCANLSVARDLLISALREGGRIRSDDLERVVELTSTHEGFQEIYDDLELRKKQYAVGDPVAMLFDIWDSVKFCLEKRGEARRPADLNDPCDAMRILEHAFYSLRWFIVMDEHKWHNRNRKLMILKDAIPALKTVYNMIPSLDPGPMEGIAIVSSKSGELIHSDSGAVVVETRDVAEKVLDLWEKSAKSFSRADYAIRKVRLSVEKGCEILGEVL